MDRDLAGLPLLSSMPTLVMLVTAAAGAFGIERGAFPRWVFLAEVLRNWLLLLFFQESYQFVGQEILLHLGEALTL